MSTAVPRISANELGKFVFGSPSEKKLIVHSQIHPKPFVVNRYQAAQHAILRCFEDGKFSHTLMAKEQALMEAQKASSDNRAGVLAANRRALKKFSNILEESNPPEGEHRIVRNKASFMYQGVMISVRPDIITDIKDSNRFCFLKFRFSNHKYSFDASEIVLLILRKYAESIRRDRWQFDFNSSKLVDCLSMQIFSGGGISSMKERYLDKAVDEFKSRWSIAS